MTYQGQDWLNAWPFPREDWTTRGALGLRPEVPTGLWPTGARKHSTSRDACCVAWVGGSLASASQHPRRLTQKDVDLLDKGLIASVRVIDEGTFDGP